MSWSRRAIVSLTTGGRSSGKMPSDPGCSRRFVAIDQQDAGAPVRRVGPLKVAEDALDLVLLRQGHRHVELQPDDMTLEVLPRQQRAQLVDVATVHVDPSPEADRLRVRRADAMPWRNSATSATEPAPGSSKFVGSGAPG